MLCCPIPTTAFARLPGQSGENGKALLDDVYLVEQVRVDLGTIWAVVRWAHLRCNQEFAARLPFPVQVSHAVAFVGECCVHNRHAPVTFYTLVLFQNHILVEIGWQVGQVSSLGSTPSELAAGRLTWEGIPRGRALAAGQADGPE